MITAVLKFTERTLNYAGKNWWLQILMSEKYTVELKEWMGASLL